MSPTGHSLNGGRKLLVIIVVMLIALLATLIFAIYAFVQMQDYKNNSDKKSNIAVEAANSKLTAALQAKFAESEKQPLKTYTGPAQYGSLKIVYPKTWSAYVVEQAGNTTPLEGYFYPDVVPNISEDQNNYALRVEITSADYQSILQQYQTQLSAGSLKASAFKPSLVASATVGVKMDGQIATGKKGSMIILPMRDKVLRVWTENDANISDFNDFILKNLSYSP